MLLLLASWFVDDEDVVVPVLLLAWLLLLLFESTLCCGLTCCCNNNDWCCCNGFCGCCCFVSKSRGRMLQTHSGASPEKCTTPLRDTTLCVPSRSTRRNSHTPDPNGVVSISFCLAASASIKAALSKRTLSSQRRDQKLLPSRSCGTKSKKRETECDTNQSLPEESKTTIRSGMLLRICSLRRNSSFSSLSSTMNCFLRLRLNCADRRLAARFSNFFSSITTGPVVTTDDDDDDEVMAAVVADEDDVLLPSNETSVD
mmetsp:Transcript_29713/g.45525  ORF Transcript_29713/g.45525 Transcript_29713/m.45525 type:complete len:257 (-) Transcript_29713:138-908(-)